MPKRAQRALQRARDRLGHLQDSPEEDKGILVQSCDDGEPRAMKKDTDSDSDRDSEYVGNRRRGADDVGSSTPGSLQG